MARKIDLKLQERRRMQVINAASECFNNNGFHQTSMADIFTKAKMSPGVVYHYFEGKDSIIQAIAEEFSDDNIIFFKNLNSKSNFIHGYLKAAKKSLSETKKHVKYSRLIIEIYAESFGNDKVREVVNNLDSELISGLQKHVKQAIINKEITSKVDAVTITYMLIALMEGLEDRIIQSPKIKLPKLFKMLESITRNMLIK
ncbi:MAG: TetR/AcrR family transcriptional regulator [Pseudomonadota bacterium]